MRATSSPTHAGSGQHQHRNRRHAAAAAIEPEENPPMKFPFGDSLGGRGSGGGGGQRSRYFPTTARRRASQDGYGRAGPARRKSTESRHSAPARYHEYDEEEKEGSPIRFRDIEEIEDLREASSSVILRTGGAGDGTSVRSTSPASGGLVGPSNPFRSEDLRSVSSTDLSSVMGDAESTTIDTGDRSGCHSFSSKDSITSFRSFGGLLESLSELSGDSSSSSSSTRSFDLSAMMGDKSSGRCCRSSISARRCARIAVVVAAALALAMLAYQAGHGISKSMRAGVDPSTSKFETMTDGSNSFRKLSGSQHRGGSGNGSSSQVQDAAQDYRPGAVAKDEAAPAGRAIPAYKEFKRNDKVNLDSEIVALKERSVMDHNDKWKH